MREIKFRAWNKNGKRLYKREWLKQNFISSIFNTNDWILMQFTGLRDATKWNQLTETEKRDWIDGGETEQTWRGKEIYEGDVVRWPKKNDDLVNLVIRFDEKDCGYYADTIEGVPDSWVDSSCEVVGNIYQNSELIKVI